MPPLPCQATHEHDRRLAEHVTYVHRFSSHPELEVEALEPQFMRASCCRNTKDAVSAPKTVPRLPPWAIGMRRPLLRNPERRLLWTLAVVSL